jgi:hypothetical protein
LLEEYSIELCLILAVGGCGWLAELYEKRRTGAISRVCIKVRILFHSAGIRNKIFIPAITREGAKGAHRFLLLPAAISPHKSALP